MTEIVSLTEYINILYDVAEDKSTSILDECLLEVSEKVSMDINKLKAVLESTLTPGKAKIMRPDKYDTLVVCNNNTEAESKDAYNPLISIVDITRSIFMDKPSPGKKVDLYGFFGDPETESLLKDRKFDYLIAGYCPWMIYQDPKTSKVRPKFIDLVKKRLNPNGVWIIISYNENGDILSKDIETYGFRSVKPRTVQFLKKKNARYLSKLIVMKKLD